MARVTQIKDVVRIRLHPRILHLCDTQAKQSGKNLSQHIEALIINNKDQGKS